MRIAVVEDDDGVGNALVAGLTRQAHQPVRMKFGSELLLHHGEVDFVLLDLGLPDRDGLEVLRQLRQVSAVPVIILTARDDERSVVRGLRGGADDYLVKPARHVGALRSHRSGAPAKHGRRRRRTTRSGHRRRPRRPRFPHRHRGGHRGGPDVEGVLPSRDPAREPGRRGQPSATDGSGLGDAFVAVSRSLDVHIGTLRAKLDRPGLISTIRGFGYRWVC